MAKPYREPPSQPMVDAIAELFGADSVYYAAAQRARQVRTRAEVARFWRLLDNLPAAQVGRLAGLAVGLGGRGEGGTPALQLGRPHRESDENGAA